MEEIQGPQCNLVYFQDYIFVIFSAPGMGAVPLAW